MSGGRVALVIWICDVLANDILCENLVSQESDAWVEVEVMEGMKVSVSDLCYVPV